MKQFVSVGFVLLSLATLFSCGGTGTGVQGEMSTQEYDGQTVYLYSIPGYKPIDSTRIDGKNFKFNVPDSLGLYELRTRKSLKDFYFVTLPFVAGEGNVKVYMGDKVVTTGTLSNDRLQDFLLAIDQFYIDCVKSGKSVKEAVPAFKDFLKEQVVANRDNPVSAYILVAFKSRFTADEYTQLSGQLKAEFQPLLDR